MRKSHQIKMSQFNAIAVQAIGSTFPNELELNITTAVISPLRPEEALEKRPTQKFIC